MDYSVIFHEQPVSVAPATNDVATTTQNVATSTSALQQDIISVLLQPLNALLAQGSAHQNIGLLIGFLAFVYTVNK